MPEANEPLISYAQNCEDIVLWRALSHIKNGFYIDVGANHPIEDSVTQLFYEKGWRGINIEPLKECYELLRTQRPLDKNLQVAISDMPGESVFYQVEFPRAKISTLNSDLAKSYFKSKYEFHEKKINTTTLDLILSEHPIDNIHFLKIDVEGEEKSVLSGLNLQLYRPWIIVIEAISPDSLLKNHDNWERIFLNNGYEFVLFDGINRFYLANEHSELRKFINYPAVSILDRFITLKHKLILEDHQDKENEIKILKIENEYLQSKNKHLQSNLKQIKSELSKIHAGIGWKIARSFHHWLELTLELFLIIKFFFFLFLKALVRMVAKISFARRLFNYFKLKYPNFYEYSTKHRGKIVYNSSIFFLLNQSPLLKKIAKRIYFQFPRFSKFLLKFLKIFNTDNLDLSFKHISKEKIELQDEINAFLNDLKIEIVGNKFK